MYNGWGLTIDIIVGAFYIIMYNGWGPTIVYIYTIAWVYYIMCNGCWPTIYVQCTMVGTLLYM